MTLEELRRHKPQIEAIAAKYGVSNLRVFGSVLRGEVHAHSDLDLLARMPGEERRYTLFDHVRLKRELAETLNTEVDLVNDRCLHKYIGPYILREAVPL